jgi:hypothetical protein
MGLSAALLEQYPHLLPEHQPTGATITGVAVRDPGARR